MNWNRNVNDNKFMKRWCRLIWSLIWCHINIWIRRSERANERTRRKAFTLIARARARKRCHIISYCVFILLFFVDTFEFFLAYIQNVGIRHLLIRWYAVSIYFWSQIYRSQLAQDQDPKASLSSITFYISWSSASVATAYSFPNATTDTTFSSLIITTIIYFCKDEWSLLLLSFYSIDSSELWAATNGHDAQVKASNRCF